MLLSRIKRPRRSRLVSFLKHDLEFILYRENHSFNTNKFSWYRHGLKIIYYLDYYLAAIDRIFCMPEYEKKLFLIFWYGIVSCYSELRTFYRTQNVLVSKTNHAGLMIQTKDVISQYIGNGSRFLSSVKIFYLTTSITINMWKQKQ